MPIYEYRCRNGHVFEVSQSMSEDPVTSCDECGAPTERVFHPIAVHFKGSGFYTTDYARKGSGADGGEGGDKKGADEKGADDKAKAGKDSGSGKKGGEGSPGGGGGAAKKGSEGEGKAKTGTGSD